MKKIVIFLFLLTFAFAKPFETAFVQKNNGIEFTLKMAKGIHVYKDSIKVLINNKPVKINLPKAKTYMDEKVYFNKVSFFIPYIKPLKVKFQGCSNTVCYVPQTVAFTPKTVKTLPKAKTKITQTQEKNSFFANKSVLMILISFFGFGLLLSFTPCIFPMIPILSGLLVKHSKRHPLFVSFVYVLSMSVTYTVAGVLAGLFGKNIQVMFQNPYIILSFSAVFVILALSMFGFFEIKIPNSLQTKFSQKGSEKAGILGVAAMGFFSALIVGPCVAPPLAGALLYIGKTGNALLGGSALFLMSLGMGTPLLLIGLGAGKILPKAGNWMIYINRFFGVIMLVIAVYFASRVLNEKITDFLYALIAIGTGLYLAPFEKIENYKQLIIKTAAFLLLLTGSILIFNIFTSDTYQKNTAQQWQKVHNIKELEKIVKNNSSVLVDFSAKWCIACKEYEEKVFSDPEIQNLFRRYKLVRVDVTDNTPAEQMLLHKFSLVGPPAVLIFKNGKLQTKIVGYHPKKQFLNLIERKTK